MNTDQKATAAESAQIEIKHNISAPQSPSPADAALPPLPLPSLVVWHAWFEHAGLKCKANVPRGDYVAFFVT